MSDLSLKNVTKLYGNNIKAVTDFSLDVSHGEFIVLVGPSGCGKSTILQIISGLEDEIEGEVWIEGKMVNDVPPKDRDIAMVFQNYSLYPYMSVYENMAFGLKMRKIPKEQIKINIDKAAQILELDELMDRKPKELSGGQRQRVAIGRALVRNPKIFLMDEPLSNLDMKLKNSLRKEIARLHRELDTTFVYVTHDQTEAMTLGTRIVVMDRGIIQQVGTPQELYECPSNKFVAGFIGNPQMNFFKSRCIPYENEIKIEINGNTMSLPDNFSRMLKQKGYAGKEIIIGIRPNEIYESSPMAEKYPENTIIITADHFETTGSESYVYIMVNGEEVTVKSDVHTKLKIGDAGAFTFNPHRIHIFDNDTGKRIFR